MRLVEIDGSMGEGGGQILRTTLALSAVLGVPVKITNIRAKRKNPGLQRQHLTGVRAVAQLSNARVVGAALGSTTIEFYPGKLRGGEYRFDIGTAGSVTLVLQALLPILPFLEKPTKITVTGGTDVPWSPTIDYVIYVITKILSKVGLKLEAQLLRRGHYPRGGGMVIYRVDDPPRKLSPLILDERGEILEIRGRSHAVALPEHVAVRQARSAEEMLRGKLGRNIKIAIELEKDPQGKNVLGPGSGITLWAKCNNSVLGSDSLGARGKPAEKVGREAAQKLIEDLSTNAALDRHMSDMIIPFLALAGGTSKITGSKLTLHATTNIMVVRRLVPDARIVVKGEENAPFMLEVRGIGL